MGAHDPWVQARRAARWLLASTEGYNVMVPLLALADAFLTALIVWRVPYTEIDFTTYVGQARLFLNGERTYSHLDPVDGSGPCVYPAGHVYVYAFFAWLSRDATNLLPAQLVFGVLYLTTFWVVAQLYRYARVPPIMLVCLVLSKRLHSIYVLRLFNDPIAMLVLYGSALLLCQRRWRMASVVFRCVACSHSIALSIKMNVLLFLPGLCVVLYRAQGAAQALLSLGLAVLVQVLLGLPFLVNDAPSYLRAAFDFSRVFLYKWTVNWRFLGEATFLHPHTAQLLLALHLLGLTLFGVFRWTGLGTEGVRWMVRRWHGERPLTMTPCCMYQS